MMPQPNTSVSTECLTDAHIDPAKFMKDSPPRCGIINPQATDNSMSWEMSCTMQSGSMEGAAQFTSSGNAVSGAMTMNMSMGGQQVTAPNQWTGRRICECD